MGFSRPPPSPGFGAHRFGATAGGFGFVPLTLTAPSSQDDSKVGLSGHPVAILRPFADEDALLSPRLETMTNNPLHAPFSSSLPAMQFIEVPPTPGDGVFSPRESMFPRDPFFPFGRPTQVADPRSPPTKGETPIVRSIDGMI